MKLQCVVAGWLVVLTLVVTTVSRGADLAYLDAFCDPYYVGRDFPKLTTPQWVGEEGVDAVVVLAIDDMRDPAKYEAYLRPILDRLKKIDERAPVSIMTNSVDPKHPQLAAWLKEGVNIDVHSITHPCPCLQGGDFPAAAKTYHDCVDLMAEIAGNEPVAFRVPCCDSQNTPSPRFYAEIFNQKSAKGKFLRIDSSVFNIVTSNDKSLPRELTIGDDCKSRFQRYLPFPSFVNTIEDYPYPYVIGGLCWQFPCVVPSDWEAQNVQRPNNPETVADMQRALDAVVLKQGVYNLVFHPHGWIRNDQIVELIDHAEKKYGKRVKFLNFRECAERISKNLLRGGHLRADDGGDSGVRLLDVNDDGLLDVVIGNDELRTSRVWQPKEGRWCETDFPVVLVGRQDGEVIDAGVRFGIVREDGFPSCLLNTERQSGGWHFDGDKWQADEEFAIAVAVDDKPLRTSIGGIDQGVRLRDLDGDGRCELIAGGSDRQAVFRWEEKTHAWERLPFVLPEGVSLVDEQGHDAGLRFVDINADGRDDIIFSNEQRWSAHLFDSIEKGWTQSAASDRAADDAIPPIVRGATNNGAWFHSGQLWAQNEDTNRLPSGVARIALEKVLEKIQNANAANDNGQPSPKTPEESLQSIQVPAGLKIELVATEPLVEDPIAFDWGPDGRLWVVEMRDYPLGIDGKGKPGGRVKLLTDTDGDGRYDKASVFLDDLPFPTGLKFWRDGVLVVAAPRIIFAKDTDNDGRADVVETCYEGFGEGNQQHRVNGLRWGLDNWLYLANGDSGGSIRSLKTDEVADIRSRDLRIEPDSGRLTAISGQTQFGRNRDDWGNWFGGNNSLPVGHYQLDDVYLRRNPHFTPPAVRRDISQTPGTARVYPTSKSLERFNYPGSVNHFTSACSPMIYRDTLLGEKYQGNVFVCEPVHNLVHRELVTPRGSTFASRRADDERESEFLASTDNWFRPTMVRTGPDGALWITDMYRMVIEHPEWIPAVWQQRLDLRAGHDRGRIYRVVPTEGAMLKMPRLDQRDTAQLVAQLENTNGTLRDMAHQLLLWRDEPAAVALLESLATAGKTPAGRLHALCVLDGLDKLSPSVVRQALHDTHPAVRRHAIRVSEQQFSDLPEVMHDLVALATDVDPQVRLQLAYSAGEWHSASASALVLAQLLTSAGDDELLRAAALSSLHGKNIGPLTTAILDDDQQANAASLWLTLLPQAVALGAGESLLPAIDKLAQADKKGTYSASQLLSVATAFSQFEKQPKLKETTAAARERLGPMFQFSARQVGNDNAIPSMRVAALTVLRHADAGSRPNADVLIGLLSPKHPPLVQSAALASLVSSDAAAMPKALTQWRTFTPALRGELLEAMLARPELSRMLLDAVEAKSIAATHFDAHRRRQLLEHPDEAIRRRATALLAAGAGANSQNQADTLAALKLTGDVSRGRALFVKQCAACHRLEEVGSAVGPNLAALTDRSPAALLVAIVDPSRAVEDKFLSYTAVTESGHIHTGLLEAEAGESITLRTGEGRSVTLLRREIEEFVTSGKSFMPDQLFQDLGAQGLADVIAYVRGAGVLPKTFPGNHPALVRADDQGVIQLPATAASIYGDRIIFEQKYQNIGWWYGADDHAVWSFDVKTPGEFTIEIDYACGDGSAGNMLALQLGGHQVNWKVTGTGTWDDYRWSKVGTVRLPAGRRELIVRPIGPIQNALLDLRTVRLNP